MCFMFDVVIAVFNLLFYLIIVAVGWNEHGNLGVGSDDGERESEGEG